MASVAAGASKEVEDKMAEYALCLGRAFQIIDDVLDYTGSKDNIGKNLGTDLREGKMTMPLILRFETLFRRRRKDYSYCSQQQ